MAGDFRKILAEVAYLWRLFSLLMAQETFYLKGFPASTYNLS